MKFIRNMRCSLIQTSIIGWTVLLGLSISLLVSPGTAQAARLSGDPLVIIDADVTNQYGPCTEVFQANIGTKEETTTRISCPAGALLKAEIVHQSQAIAQHEPYVLAPAPNASAAEKQRIYRQFQQLDDANTRALQQSLSKTAIHPLVQCGQSGGFSMWWFTDDNTELLSKISYYKSTNCSTVAFDTSSIEYLYGGSNYPLEYYDWEVDEYAGQTYPAIYSHDCPAITDNLDTTVSYFVGGSAAPGYYYENWISWDSCGGSPWSLTGGFDEQHNNIGPIN